ncbi:MAG: pilin [Candidatus Saccharibacteria bacterium]|nr:pilin [Candidatus Saccharibacteria bacterium]
MKKIFSLVLALILGITVTTVAFPSEASALDCEHSILGLRPWYAGLTTTAKDSTGTETCVIKSPGQISSDNPQASYFWTIVLNISADISLIAGYVAIIFMVYGGYKYIMSTGEPGKVAMAKSIITNALIGLVIAILATVIVNTILMVIGANAS